jgi:hypothetical protein
MAIDANGSVGLDPCASRPPSAGPTIVPTEDRMTAGPTWPAPSPSAVSHAAPAVHSTPKDSPKAIRPASSTGRDGTAWAMHASTNSTPAVSVTRRAPKRSASTPAGNDTASIARPGSASTSAASELDSP